MARRTQSASTAAGHNASGSGKPSKAELIRQTAKELGKFRSRDIVAKLKEKGIEVGYTQIAKALKAGGFRRRRRRKGASAAATGLRRGRQRRAGAAGNSTGRALDLEALIATKALVQKIGGIEAAEEALRALKRLG